MPWDASVLVVVPLVRTDRSTRATTVRRDADADGGRAAGDRRRRAGRVGGPAGLAARRQPALRLGPGRLVAALRPRGPFDAAPGTEPVALSAEAAEFHGPDWVLGQTTMAELPDGSLAARRTVAGRDASGALRTLGDARRDPTPLPQPCVSISAVCAHGDGVA